MQQRFAPQAYSGHEVMAAALAAPPVPNIVVVDMHRRSGSKLFLRTVGAIRTRKLTNMELRGTRGQSIFHDATPPPSLLRNVLFGAALIRDLGGSRAAGT